MTTGGRPGEVEEVADAGAAVGEAEVRVAGVDARVDDADHDPAPGQVEAGARGGRAHRRRAQVEDPVTGCISATGSGFSRRATWRAKASRSGRFLSTTARSSQRRSAPGLPLPPLCRRRRRCRFQGLLGNRLHHERKCLSQTAGVGQEGSLPCDLHFTLQERQLVISAATAGRRETVSLPLGGEEPARSSDMTEVFRGQFAKCGDTPFILGNLSAEGFPAIMIPAGNAEGDQEDFYRELERRILPGIEKERAGTESQALASLPAEKTGHCRPATGTDRQGGEKR